MPSEKPQKSRVISIRLPRDVYETGQKLAKADRRSFSNYVLTLIEKDAEHADAAEAIHDTDLLLDCLRVAEDDPHLDPPDTDLDT